MLSHKINFNTFKSIEIIQNMFSNKVSRKISQSKKRNGNFYLSIKKNRIFHRMEHPQTLKGQF